MLRLSCALALLPFLAALPAQADSAKTPPVHLGPNISVQGYATQNPQCHAWTDGCVLCTSDGSGRSQCSTPGIACQPHGLTCKMMMPTP